MASSKLKAPAIYLNYQFNMPVKRTNFLIRPIINCEVRITLSVASRILNFTIFSAKKEPAHKRKAANLQMII
jgi:hypothetical protein